MMWVMWAIILGFEIDFKNKKKLFVKPPSPLGHDGGPYPSPSISYTILTVPKLVSTYIHLEVSGH